MNTENDTPIFDCPLGYEVEPDYTHSFYREDEDGYEDDLDINTFSVREDWSRSSESNKERRIKNLRFQDRNNPWRNQYR